jgi:hypothetical protein
MKNLNPKLLLTLGILSLVSAKTYSQITVPEGRPQTGKSVKCLKGLCVGDRVFALGEDGDQSRLDINCARKVKKIFDSGKVEVSGNKSIIHSCYEFSADYKISSLYKLESLASKKEALTSCAYFYHTSQPMEGEMCSFTPTHKLVSATNKDRVIYASANKNDKGSMNRNPLSSEVLFALENLGELVKGSIVKIKGDDVRSYKIMVLTDGPILIQDFLGRNLTVTPDDISHESSEPKMNLDGVKVGSWVIKKDGTYFSGLKLIDTVTAIDGAHDFITENYAITNSSVLELVESGCYGNICSGKTVWFRDGREKTQSLKVLGVTQSGKIMVDRNWVVDASRILAVE